MIFAPPPPVPSLIEHVACTVPQGPYAMPTAAEITAALTNLGGYTPAQMAEILKSVQGLGLAAPTTPAMQQSAQVSAGTAATVQAYSQNAAAAYNAPASGGQPTPQTSGTTAWQTVTGGTQGTTSGQTNGGDDDNDNDSDGGSAGSWRSGGGNSGGSNATQPQPVAIPAPTPVQQPDTGVVPAGLGTDCLTPVPQPPAPLAPIVVPQPPSQPTGGGGTVTAGNGNGGNGNNGGTSGNGGGYNVTPTATTPGGNTVPVGSLMAPYCKASGSQNVTGSGQTNQGAIRAADFTKTLAVENHFRNGPPFTLPAVEKALAYLNPNGIGTGVSTVRDDTVSSESDLAELGKLGYKLDMYLSYNPGGGNVFSQFSRTLAPLISANYVSLVEGGLEVDNVGWGIAVHGGSYTSQSGHTYTGYAAAAAMTQDLFNTYKSKIPVATPSMANPANGVAGGALAQGANSVGGVGGIANVGNFHFYAHNGNDPSVEMPGFLAQETGWTKGMPFIISETGFNDCGCSNYGGNQLANAPYTLNLFLDSFKAGSKLNVYYELFDDLGSGCKNDSGFESHWGLFKCDGTAKPAATALRNFVAILGDAGSNAATFASCGTVNYTLSGLSSTGSSLLMQKSDGTYELVIWNNANDMSGAVHSSNVGVNLGGSYSYQIFDPIVGTNVQQSGSGSSLNVGISDHPVIIQLTPTGTATASTIP